MNRSIFHMELKPLKNADISDLLVRALNIARQLQIDVHFDYEDADGRYQFAVNPEHTVDRLMTEHQLIRDQYLKERD